MSIVDELNYFLGLHIKQVDTGIFISQAKYAKNKVKELDPSGYKIMIGSLLYLTASCPEKAFNVTSL